MKFVLSNKPLNQIEADLEVILVVNKNLDHPWVQDRTDLALFGFNGEEEQVAFLPHLARLYVSTPSLEHDEIRNATAKAIKTLKKSHAKSLKIGTYIDKCPVVNIKAMVDGFIFGDYAFDKYKSKKEEHSIQEIMISTQEYSGKSFSFENAQEAISQAQIVANATNFVRDIVNTTPDDMTPKKFAKVAKILAEENALECHIYNKKFLEENKMGAFLAVSRASNHPPRLVHLIYRPKNPKYKIAIVGKGLTYDSGGLSLKPSEHMVTMKADKSGASAVMGIIKAVSELALPIELHAIAGLCENMIGGNAYKPDDVLVAKNGKTIEVRNTDAEGRLVLADCLCYAQELKPDFILDFATLTGACVVALGEYTTGVMGFNKELKEQILKAAEASGELAAELPFNKYLGKLLKSSVADISNISSSRYGGAITAAMFLGEFIEEANRDKWVHLDIAGPAYIEKEWGYNPYGAGAAGVRMAVKWMQKLTSEKKEHN